MLDLKNKRLLLLGSSIWKEIIKEWADANGVYLIFAGLYPAPLDEIADEYYRIDTTNADLMIPFIRQHQVDGIFMGGSEFIISNTCDYINELQYPCYCTRKQWDICQNKLEFKKLCREYGVPCVQEFSVEDDPSTFDYPIIVKPTDSCAAKGISVCQNEEEYRNALNHALEYSTEKRVIIEKFVENKGTTMSVKYIAVDGELYLEAVGDRYVLDSNKGKALITAAAFYPSKYTDKYINEVDEKVKNMFKGIGIKNGSFFMEAIANDEGIWFYEMGLRISGGMTWKITEKTCGVNELKMLLNYAVSGKMCEEEDVCKINPYLNGYYSASVSIPLKVGTIGKVMGMDNVRTINEVGKIIEYWKEGDEILSKHQATLDQLYARIPIIVKGKDRLIEIMHQIRESISVKDIDGDEMIIWSRFDEIIKDYNK